MGKNVWAWFLFQRNLSSISEPFQKVYDHTIKCCQLLMIPEVLGELSLHTNKARHSSYFSLTSWQISFLMSLSFRFDVSAREHPQSQDLFLIVSSLESSWPLEKHRLDVPEFSTVGSSEANSRTYILQEKGAQVQIRAWFSEPQKVQCRTPGEAWEHQGDGLPKASIARFWRKDLSFD